MWNLTKTLNVLHRDNWTILAIEIINRYTQEVHYITKMYGWDPRYLTEENEDLQWDFAGALLYSITIITTIGQ